MRVKAVVHNCETGSVEYKEVETTPVEFPSKTETKKQKALEKLRKLAENDPDIQLLLDAIS